MSEKVESLQLRWELANKTTLGQEQFIRSLEMEKALWPSRRLELSWKTEQAVHWATAEQACVTAAEAQRQTQGKRLGRKLCWLNSHWSGCIWDWPTPGRGTPFRKYNQMARPSSCFWRVPRACVCVCVTECATSGVVIQTHVNIIFSDWSSLFYCKRGSRREGGGQNQTGWDLLDSCWKQLTAARSHLKKSFIYQSNQ